MEEEIILSLSGGATKFIGILSAAQTVLELGLKPTIILGVSSGALAALPLVLGYYDQAKETGLNITLDSFFKKKPVNAKGKQTLNAMMRFVIGHNSLGVQDARKLLADIVSQSDFEHYKVNKKYPTIIVSAVNYDNGKRELFNLKTLDYIDALNAIEASSRVPIITQQMEINGSGYYDGGVCDHNLAGYFIDNSSDLNMKELVSIFSRPEDFTVNELNTKWRNNLFTTIERTLEIMNIEISKNDERLEKSLSKERDFKLTQIFLPKVMESLYDTDKTRLTKLMNDSIHCAEITFDTLK
jgi:predicted patatin/cPLA2 family phospholipase